MKKIDPNNFIIDDVFKALDKLYKRKSKKKKKSKPEDEISQDLMEINSNRESNKSVDDDCYVIEITG